MRICFWVSTRLPVTAETCIGIIYVRKINTAFYTSTSARVQILKMYSWIIAKNELMSIYKYIKFLNDFIDLFGIKLYHGVPSFPGQYFHRYNIVARELQDFGTCGPIIIAYNVLQKINTPLNHNDSYYVQHDVKQYHRY